MTLGVCGPNTFDERGLLGVAFHPKYAQNGLLYTYTSEPESGPATFFSTVPAGTADHQNVVAEWHVPNPGNPASVVDPNSRRELLRVNWPQFNHDGGDLAFGPDGKLYISMGDGGGADDADGQLFNRPRDPNPGCAVSVPMVGHQGDGNAQKLNVPLGKILRIDVDGRDSANGQYGIPRDNPFVKTSGALPEIWAYGFRNPFRFSFDTRTGDLFVGDVGQNDIEEVSLVVKGGNHGWNVKEGTLFFHINGTAEGFASPTPDLDRTIPSSSSSPSRSTTPTTKATRSSAGSSITAHGSPTSSGGTSSATSPCSSSSRRDLTTTGGYSSWTPAATTSRRSASFRCFPAVPSLWRCSDLARMPPARSTRSATCRACPSRTPRAGPPGASSSSSPRQRPNFSPSRGSHAAPPAPARVRGRRALTPFRQHAGRPTRAAIGAISVLGHRRRGYRRPVAGDAIVAEGDDLTSQDLNPSRLPVIMVFEIRTVASAPLTATPTLPLPVATELSMFNSALPAPTAAVNPLLAFPAAMLLRTVTFEPSSTRRPFLFPSSLTPSIEA